MITSLLKAGLSWMVGRFLDRFFPSKTAESVELKQAKEALDAKKRMEAVNDAPASKRLHDGKF